MLPTKALVTIIEADLLTVRLPRRAKYPGLTKKKSGVDRLWSDFS